MHGLRKGGKPEVLWQMGHKSVQFSECGCLFEAMSSSAGCSPGDTGAERWGPGAAWIFVAEVELTAKTWELPPLGETPDGIVSCGRPRAGRLSSRGGSSSSGRSTTSCPGTPLTVGRAAAYHQTVPSERQENGISVHFCVVDQVVNTNKNDTDHPCLRTK